MSFLKKMEVTSPGSGLIPGDEGHIDGKLGTRSVDDLFVSGWVGGVCAVKGPFILGVDRGCGCRFYFR
jgi:hypothetical protein